MPTVEELLAVAEMDITAEQVEQYPIEVIEIDAKTREMQIPDGEILFGVESDEKAERKYFRVLKDVGNDIDLSTLQMRVIYQNASGTDEGKDIYIVTDMQVSGNYVEFSWELSRKVTKYKGNVNFIICAIRVNPDGTITNEWNTTIAKGTVKQGLEVTIDAGQEEQARDYLTQLQNELLKVANEQKAAVETKGQEVIKTIPSDYTQMQKDIGSLKEDKIDKPSIADNGKIPRAKEGGVEWVEVGQPTDEQTNSAVSSWLDEHPEATTTVQDGAITEPKISPSFLPYIKNDYVTPQMFGAKGNGTTDDTKALQEAVDSGICVFIPQGVYLITTAVVIRNNVTICGVGDNTVLKAQDNTIFNVVNGSLICEFITFSSNSVVYKQNANDLKVFPFEYYSFTCSSENTIGVYSESKNPCKFFNCSFIGLYKGASVLNNSEFHDCRFSKCMTACDCRSFDPFFWCCYFTACKQGIIMSNTNYNTMFVYNCWFDQISEHAIGSLETSVGGYINATFDQIGGSAICAKTLNRININGRFSRCGVKYVCANSSDKQFENGSDSAVIHAENSANQLYVNASFVNMFMPSTDISAVPLVLSVRTGYKMFITGFMDTDSKYVALNKNNTGLLIDGNNVYKISGISLVEVL